MGIGPNEAGHLVECHRTINAVKCTTVLQDSFVQSASTLNKEEEWHFIFQHDNSPPHKASEKPKFMRSCLEFLWLNAHQTVQTLKCTVLHEIRARS